MLNRFSDRASDDPRDLRVAAIKTCGATRIRARENIPEAQSSLLSIIHSPRFSFFFSLIRWDITKVGQGD